MCSVGVLLFLQALTLSALRINPGSVPELTSTSVRSNVSASEGAGTGGVPVFVPSRAEAHPIQQQHWAHNLTVGEKSDIDYAHNHGLDRWCGPQNTVFDLGFYDGADSKPYLEGGFCVVGVEADPTLVQLAVDNFAPWIETGQLRMANVAIAPAGNATSFTTFYINKCSREWNSFYYTVGCRQCEPPHSIDPAACDQIPVQALSCGDLFTTFGAAYYLKLDIEGAETGCFAALWDFGLTSAYIPPFISTEITQLDYLDSLHHLGYDGFKLVRQDRLHTGQSSVSGPWGDNALDCRYETQWRSYVDARAELTAIFAKGFDSTDPCPGGTCHIHDQNGCATSTMWYDVHAKKLLAPQASR